MRDGWERLEVGDITDPVKKGAPSGTEPFKYIDISSVSQDSKRIVEARSLPSAQAPGRARQHVLAGDVLVSTVRPNLNAVAEVPAQLDGAIASTGFAVLRGNDRVVPGYLYHWVRSQSFIEDMTHRATGSNYPAVTEKIVKSSSIYLPPLPEQKRIADLLASVDSAVESSERLIESNRHARSVMLTTALSKESATDGDEWESRLLSELCANDGTIQTGPFGSQLHSYDYAEEGTPVVMPTNMWHGRIVLDDIARVKEEDLLRLSRHALRAGDIVYSRRGDVTKSALVTESEAGFLCGTGCLLVRPNSDVHVDWLYHWLNREDTKKWVVDHAVGATMANLNTKILGRVPVEVPPSRTQRKIAELANRFDDLDNAARDSLAKYRNLRSNILSALLLGHHRIPELYDELLAVAA